MTFDGTPSRRQMVEHFIDGQPHQMSVEGEGGFLINALKDKHRLMYHVMISRVLPIKSLAIVMQERDLCLYAFLTRCSIDYGSFVLSTIMGVRLADQATSLPYGALVTQIVEHAVISLAGEELMKPRGPFTS